MAPNGIRPRLKELKKQIDDLVDEHGTTLVDMVRIGKLGAGKVIAEFPRETRNVE